MRNFVLAILVLFVGLAAFALPTVVEAGRVTVTPTPPATVMPTATPSPTPRTATITVRRTVTTVPMTVEVVTATATVSPTPRTATISTEGGTRVVPLTVERTGETWITVTVLFTGGGQAYARWAEREKRLGLWVNVAKGAMISSGSSVTIPVWSSLSVSKSGCQSYVGTPGYSRPITLNCE